MVLFFETESKYHGHWWLNSSLNNHNWNLFKVWCAKEKTAKSTVPANKNALKQSMPSLWSQGKSNDHMKGKTKATRTPAFWDTAAPHDSHWWFTSDPKSKQDEVKVTNFKKLANIKILKFCKKLYTRHIFCSCSIRCINIKWLQPEL